MLRFPSMGTDVCLFSLALLDLRFGFSVVECRDVGFWFEAGLIGEVKDVPYPASRGFPRWIGPRDGAARRTSHAAFVATSPRVPSTAPGHAWAFAHVGPR